MKIIYHISTALAVTALASCSQFNEASDTPRIEGKTLEISLSPSIGDGYSVTLDNMLVKLDNYNEGLHYEKEFSGSSCTVENIIPGIYSINVSGKGHTEDGTEYLVAGNAVGEDIVSSKNLRIEVQGAQKGALVFSEMYYCGSKPPVGFSWFRDQFYEIANNTDEVQYIDGLYFAHLTAINFDKSRPVWSDPNPEKFVHAERVWQFPGSGHDYPIQPGESVVVAQLAVNHKLDRYNPNSPVDLSGAEFEFNMNNVNYPDNPALDMIHVFYDGNSTMSGLQYLVSVFGASYVIFRVPEGETWDPVNDKSFQAVNSADSWGSIVALVPIRYIVDGVENIRNETYVEAKNLQAVIDAGFQSIGDTYRGLGITRKVESTGHGGAIIYQDSNNSTDDFEGKVVPVVHRHSKSPSWNTWKSDK